MLNKAPDSTQLSLGSACNGDLRPDGIIVLLHLLAHPAVLCLNALTLMCIHLLQPLDLTAVATPRV